MDPTQSDINSIDHNAGTSWNWNTIDISSNNEPKAITAYYHTTNTRDESTNSKIVMFNSDGSLVDSVRLRPSYPTYSYPAHGHLGSDSRRQQ